MTSDVTSRGFRRASPSGGAAFVDDRRRDGSSSSPSTTTTSAIDRAIDRARERATRAERALQEKMSRSMRDLTNRPRRDEGARETFGTRTGGERGSKIKTPTTRGDGRGEDRSTVRDGREMSGDARETARGRGATERTSPRSWIDDVVARATAEAERAEAEGDRRMRARAASTVAAVMRRGMKSASMPEGRGAASGGASGGVDSEMAEASPNGSARTSSPRYKKSDVEAIEATIRTDFENKLKLMRERAEAAEQEVAQLTSKCQELENGRRSARNALAEMASQNAKLVSAFAAKKDEVRALKELAEASAADVDVKAQNMELKEALREARADVRAARESEAVRVKELEAMTREFERARARAGGGDGDAATLRTKLTTVIKELELEREAFSAQKAAWKQERMKLVRLAADYSPSRRSDAASEANDVKSSPKMTTPKKHARPTSRSPMKKPAAGASPRRSPRSAKKHTLRQQAEALKVRGNQNFHAKSYDSALQAYTEALAIEFDDTAFRAVLHANKAAALQAMGKFCDAVMECCVSRTYDDGYIRSLQRRADAYLSMGDWPQAMKDLEELEPHMGEDCALKLREAKRKVKNGCTSCEHYSVLGLHSRATKADVTKAYKSLALKFHPDKAPSDAVRPASEALFKRVAEAYAILKDTAKRAAYDASLTASRIRRTHSM
jgi:hypothetical protein